MVNTLIIVISLLVAFVTGFFCAVKAIQIGLRWQMQTVNRQEPVLNSPVQAVTQAVTQHKVDELNKYSKEQMQEWMFGKGDG